MNCPNCQTDNPQGEQFCGACGAELNGAVSADQNQPQDKGQDSSLTSSPAIATLSFDGKDFPLYEGAKFLIAREGTDKCTPDLAISADAVSSTPVEVSVESGKLVVRDTGTSVGTRIVKYLGPGESMEIKPGEMIMMGDQLITIT